MTASSAMQSQLQRNFAVLLLKYAEKAGFSRYFLHPADQRKLPPRPLRSCCSGFSPEPPLVVPFQEPALANAWRSQTEHSAKANLTFASTQHCFFPGGRFLRYCGARNAGQRSGFGVGELPLGIAALALAICSRQFGMGELVPFTFR